MQKVLGMRLKQAREEKRYTQVEAARLVDISNGTLSGYERGYRDPDTDVLNKLSKIYGVSIDYLMGKTNDPNHTLSEDAAQIVELLSYTDDEIIQSKVKLRVDGRELTNDEILRFIAYVRAERHIQGLK